MGTVRITRVYDPPEASDGWRVLVDRVWPRGRTKAEVACSRWAKEVTPSTGLRRAFHSGSVTPEEFARAYRDELAANPEFPPFAAAVADALASGDVTFVTAARLVPHGHCEVLRDAVLAHATAR